MKTLSIKQPWATAIAIGVKPVENRSKRTHYRGRIYLHTSQKPMSGEAQDIIGHERWKTLSIDEQVAIRQGMSVNGAIIGEATIVDCVLNHTSIWADQMAFDVCPETGIHILRKGQPYVWNWVLADPVLYEQSILNVKGALGLWEWEKPYDVVGSAEMV